MLDPTITAMLAEDTTHFGTLISVGKEYCEQNNFPSSFSKETKGYFLKSLTRAYWMPIRQYMGSTQWPVAKACKIAGLDPSTPTRWDKMTPTFETICLLFARCDLDLGAVKFPNGHAAFKAAFLRTIEFIRLKYLDGRQARLDDETFECLRQVLLTPAIVNYLQTPDSQFSIDDDSIQIDDFEPVAAAISSSLRTKYPSGNIRTSAAVQSAIDEWLIPWVLIYVALPPHRGRHHDFNA